MPSYSDQAGAARYVSRAKAALDMQVRHLAMGAISPWMHEENASLASGFTSIEDVVRSAYHTGAALARVHIENQADLPGWVPPVEKRTPPYLRSLLTDVRKNMRDYLNGPRDEKAMRRLMLRVQHSAGVASQRGFTDAMIRSAASLEKAGVEVRKVWTASFINNDPCPECRRLHGTEVGISEQFEVGASRVYRDLLGPPAHPHCHCTLIIFIVGVDNAGEEIDLEKPQTPAPKEMSSKDVKGLSEKVFGALLVALGRIIVFLTKGLKKK